MGRRKIEIQPIQHDRNRSVTFLKRKNGLFKKAYELGVLCSADVAVIVFGHNTKLYEYCSTDINVLLQRQREYSGERDTKGPSDYSADKGDGADDDSDSGGEAPVARGKASQSKPKGKGMTANEAQSLAPEGRFAVPPPLPEPDRTPSRSIKREELPPIITSVSAPAAPATSSVRNSAMPTSSGSSMRWQNDNGLSAQSGMNVSQSYDPRGGDWGRNMDRRPSWSAGMSASGAPGPSSPLNSFYQQSPPLSQPPISRPVNLLTSANSHPTPLNEILAAHPHLAQQLGSSASPHPGFGNSSSMHELYNNPIFQLPGQGPPPSSNQSMEMDWQMSRSMPPQTQSFNSAPRNTGQQYGVQQQSNNLTPDLSWLEILGQGDRGSSEPWSVAGDRDGGGHPKASTPLGYTPSFQQHSLKRPLSSTTPISPPETGGTPHHERDDELDTDNALGMLEGDLGGGKRARIQ